MCCGRGRLLGGHRARSLVERLRAASPTWLEAAAQGEPVPAVAHRPNTSIQLLPLGSFGVPSCRCPPISIASSVGHMNGGGSDPLRVRLAELVAALSLGIDLGFGQPMEHVLRQCMIALRLAECVGFGEEERSVVYYTALMVNVGCHSDAHEQAKWFGDDIALKSGKYDHELGSLGGVLATLRMVGSGNPPLHRFRVGVEFAVSGRHDLDGMIGQHAGFGAALGGRARAVCRGAGGARVRL